MKGVVLVHAARNFGCIVTMSFQLKHWRTNKKNPLCIYYMISKIIFLDHCVKVKYSYQK